MDGLRPEVDELDRFKNRSAPKAKAEAQKKSATQPTKAVQQKAPSSFPITLVFLLLVCTATAFSWFSWKQQIELASLKTQLNDAAGFMDQSKLLIARLEGKLSETGVELAESGTAAEKKLAYLDAEMRKLWGVAYDRNKKSIEDNQASLKSLESKLSGVQKDQAGSLKSITKEMSGLGGELKKAVKGIESHNSRLGSLDKEISAFRAEQNAVSADINNRLVEQKKGIDSVRKDTQNYLERTAKFDLSIESINASRRQLNERIVELDKKINALQLNN